MLISPRPRSRAHGPAPARAGAAGAPAPGRRPWTALAVVGAAQFMVILDMTVVNVALPSIGRSLHVGPAGLQWVVTTYLLFTGGLMLLGGRAADVLGGRRMFLAGLAVFTLASLASGLAPSEATLIVARGAQGLGAALLSPAALAVITALYAGAQRTAALAAWGALASGGAAVGVVAGGLLTSGLGWRSVFLINVPVGVAAALAALHVIPARSGRAAAGAGPAGRGRRLDIPGALLVVAGLGAVVAALAGTQQHGWAAGRTIALLAAGVILLAGFAVTERLAADPLLPPRTWRSRPLTAGMTVMLGATGILVGTFYLNTLYLQDVLGAAPVTAGAQFLPMVAVIGVAAHLAGRLLPRLGARVVAAAGLAVVAAGAVLLASQAGGGYAAAVLPGLLVLGAGVGLVFPAATVSAMSDARAGQEGLSSGMMTTAHEIGAALGVAVFAAVGAVAGSGGATATAAAGLAAGYRHGFAVAAVVAAVLAIVALLAVPAARPAAGQRAGLH
ncbi:MAG TPA: MFS transporter [Streptosporangiaceae bacterium]|nr:MFS transporter [Streptosporangiaceae bacterium]